MFFASNTNILFVHVLPSKVKLFSQIDFDESTEQNRFVVKPGVDPALDESKYYFYL